MNLATCLARTSIKDLRAIALFNKIELPDRVSRKDLHAILINHLTVPSWVENKIEHLDDKEHEIFLQIHTEGGEIPSEKLANIWGGDDPSAFDRWMWGQQIASGIPTLRLTGLIYLIHNIATESDDYVIPDSIRSNIQLKKPAKDSYQDCKAPYDSYDWSTLLLSDMFTMFRYIETYRVRQLRTGRISKRHRRSIAESVTKTNPLIREHESLTYVDYIYHCSKNISLLINHNNQLVTGHFFKHWIEKTPTEQLQDLFSAWIEDEEYDEFHEIPGVTINSAGLRNPPRIVRRIIVQSISQFPSRQWISIDSLVEYLKNNRYRFFRPLSDDRHWNLTRNQTDSSIHEGTGWKALETNLVTFIIQCPLLWVGALTLGIHNSKPSEKFMINPIGEILLFKHKKMQQISTSDQIFVQPDFEILVPENTVLSIRYKIEIIAELIQAGHVNRYRITRESVANALERGMTSCEIVHILETVSSTPLPQNVKASIDVWSDQFGKIELTRQILLKTDDKYLIEELKSNPSIRRLIDSHSDNNQLTVASGNMITLLKELKRNGYLPRISPELYLDSEPAPISLPLTKQIAETLLICLKNDINKGCTGSGSGDSGDLETVCHQLETILKHLDNF